MGQFELVLEPPQTVPDLTLKNLRFDGSQKLFILNSSSPSYSIIYLAGAGLALLFNIYQSAVFVC